ncbi:MucB/RseB C-terminal domain-containing protein [Marinobacter pelagius]|uniref:MucB/RseB C-terminal domain-containing protein n=1 Tax=Marinobacter sp. C7 TaxID=2951363 RepID=UPI001EEFD6B7|nr:MucB/RseB C-terminal domain-containing protein [Marinobacter sp. C7]MCG7201122.1 MucB/RseB C-terminal domain-containing protein [Marinobacter sp. C7]
MNRLSSRLKMGGFPALLLALLAAVVSGPVVADADESEAHQWLERLAPALNMTSYRGVFVYARGSQVHSMQIAHRYRDGVVEERLVLQDGGNGEIVRRGVNVVCVLPDRGRVRLDQVIPSGPFAEAFTSQLMPVNRWYNAEMVGEDRVAGYQAVEIALRSRDEYRYSHRLWLERSTGLLVKSHVRAASGDVMEQFQFTSLEITDNIPDEEFEIRTEGREISRNLSEEEGVAKASVVPRTSGWELGWRPEGFAPAAAPRAGRGQAVAFSDGLAAFSVFVEPAGRLKMPRGVSRIGATTVYMHELESSGRKFLVTVVGEVPPETARKVAESVRIQDSLALEGSGS